MEEGILNINRNIKLIIIEKNSEFTGSLLCDSRATIIQINIKM